MTHAAQSLLLEHLQTTQHGHILLLEGGNGWLAGEVSNLVPDGQVLSLARDIREVRTAQTRLELIPNANATSDVFPPTSGWDIVLLTIPKERRYARTLLIASFKALKPGGKLLLAGPSKWGAKAVIKDAERLFGNAAVLGYRHHQRVALCNRGNSWRDPLPKEFQQPGIAPGTQHHIIIDHPKKSLNLETHPGIFSWETLDEGTALLLDHLEVKQHNRVWDVGCGYGAIGISAAVAGARFVAMSDVNLIAIHYAQKNAIFNQVGETVEIFPADTLQPPQSTVSLPLFDIIISNPAFHQGRKVDKSMADQLINQGDDHLAPGGRLVIVANRFLNYDQYMKNYYKDVKRLAENSKFHILEAHKR